MPDDITPGRRPSRGVLVAIACVVLVVAGAGVWLAQADRSAALGGVGIGGPFTLEDGNGRPVTDRDLRGRWLLVYFGYTNCPDVCPTTLTEVAAALDKLGARGERILPVFISIDPQRDTPQVVKDYTAAFTPRLLGLTGTPEQVARVAQEYRVYYATHQNGDKTGDYSVDHSSLLYLMDPDGRFVAPIRTDESGPEIAADLARLIPALKLADGE
jgi:protein SCO1/2